MRGDYGLIRRPVLAHPVVDRKEVLVERNAVCFVVGLDLGKSKDYTAVCVDEVIECDAQIWERPAFEPVLGCKKSTKVMRHRIVNLSRYPLGTSYPDIYRSVQRVLQQLPPRPRAPQLVVDRTGVGAPVVDAMRESGLRPIAVAITGGSAVNSEGGSNYTVPKSVLASTLDIALAQDRPAITSEAQASEALRLELQNFHAKVSKAGTTAYEAWREGAHDDLVLAMALAVWQGDNLPVQARWVPFSLVGSRGL